MRTLHIYPDMHAEFGGSRYPCALGRNGIRVVKTEGDGVTPAGDWKILKVYYRPDRLDVPHTALPLEQIGPDLGWGDDPEDPANYNQPVHLPYPHSHERLWREDHLYDIVFDLDYNRHDPSAGKGSAIFIHLSRDQNDPSASGTRGCVAFRRQDLLEILALASPDTTVSIHEY